MRTGKNNREDEDYEEDELVAKREGSAYTSNANSSIGNSKDAKNKANALRSKHSVTEQRRRSKINKRNSHWRMQTFVGHPQSVKNGSASGPTYLGKFGDNNISLSPSMLASSQNPLESHAGRDIPQDTDITNKVSLPMFREGNLHASIRIDGVLDQSLHIPISDAQTTECPIIHNASNQREEMAIEGGSISVSSLYSEGLLNSLTQALQNTGLDLSQASISIQIGLGKRANKSMPVPSPIFKETGNPPLGSGDDLARANKRLRT